MDINFHLYEEDMSYMFSDQGFSSPFEKKMLKKEQWRVSFACCQLYVNSSCEIFIDQAEKVSYEINPETGNVSNNIDKETDVFAIEALVLYLSP